MQAAFVNQEPVEHLQGEAKQATSTQGTTSHKRRLLWTGFGFVGAITMSGISAMAIGFLGACSDSPSDSRRPLQYFPAFAFKPVITIVGQTGAPPAGKTTDLRKRVETKFKPGSSFLPRPRAARIITVGAEAPAPAGLVWGSALDAVIGSPEQNAGEVPYHVAWDGAQSLAPTPPPVLWEYRHTKKFSKKRAKVAGDQVQKSYDEYMKKRNSDPTVDEMTGPPPQNAGDMPHYDFSAGSDKAYTLEQSLKKRKWAHEARSISGMGTWQQYMKEQIKRIEVTGSPVQNAVDAMILQLRDALEGRGLPADAMKEYIRRNEVTGPPAQNPGDANIEELKAALKESGFTSDAKLLRNEGAARTAELLHASTLMDGFKISELKAGLQNRGLPVTGTKQDLITRLQANIEKPLVSRVALVGAGQNSQYLDKKLDAYKVTELKALLKERGLPFYGNKAELVTRLATEMVGSSR